MRRFVSLIAFILAAGFYHPTQAAPTSVKTTGNAGMASGVIAPVQTPNTSIQSIITAPEGLGSVDLSMIAPNTPFNVAETLGQASKGIDNPASEYLSQGESRPRDMRDAVTSDRPTIKTAGKEIASMGDSFRSAGIIGPKPANSGRRFFDQDTRQRGDGNYVPIGALSDSARTPGLTRYHEGGDGVSGGLAAAAALPLLLGTTASQNLGALSTLVNFALLAVAAFAIMAPLFLPGLLKKLVSSSTRANLEQGILIRNLQDIPGVLEVKLDPKQKQLNVIFGNRKHLNAARNAGRLPDKIGDFSVLYHS